MPAKEIWNLCLAAVGDKVSQQSFDMWLKPLKLLKVTDNTIDLEVPNKFFKDWICDQAGQRARRHAQARAQEQGQVRLVTAGRA